MLAGGVSLLMSGAEVATHVVGGPVLAAAVHDARVGAASALAGAGAPAGAGAAALERRRVAAAARRGRQSGDGERGGDDAAGTDVEPAAAGAAAAGQQENQRFSTVSNVMRAKHDTAKAAVSNIRA